MSNEPLKLLVIGAHPDDCDIHAGGTSALYRAAGNQVRFVSMTNGDAGHHQLAGNALAGIRRAEAEAAGRVLGIRYDVLQHRDGQLEPTLEARFELIGLIREYGPDLILTHRPNDYHPDHRYTSQLVCDAAYMVTVPPIVPDVAALRSDPVIAYFADPFTRPYPFAPTVAVDIEPVIESVVDLLDCHKSQFYEWLPYNQQLQHEVPSDPSERRVWLGKRYRARITWLADAYRDLVVSTYGDDAGRRIRYIEAFEPCEYGSPLDDAARRRLFPFLPHCHRD